MPLPFLLPYSYQLIEVNYLSTTFHTFLPGVNFPFDFKYSIFHKAELFTAYIHKSVNFEFSFLLKKYSVDLEVFIFIIFHLEFTLIYALKLEFYFIFLWEADFTCNIY